MELPRRLTSSDVFEPQEDKTPEDHLLSALSRFEALERAPDSIVENPALIDDEPIAAHVYRVNHPSGDSVEIAGDPEGYMLCYESAEECLGEPHVLIFTVKEGRVGIHFPPSDNVYGQVHTSNIMRRAAAIIDQEIVWQNQGAPS